MAPPVGYCRLKSPWRETTFRHRRLHVHADISAKCTLEEDTSHRISGTKKPVDPEVHTGCFDVAYGGSCGIRTYDQLVKSQLLYQLS